MTSVMCEVHLWSMKNQYAILDGTIGCHCYHDKGEQLAVSEQRYYAEKQQFDEGRGFVWTPKNKRPERLRDTLHDIEELLSQNHCVQIRWRNRHFLQLVLSNASVVTFVLAGHSGDIERIFLDKSFMGKLSYEHISHAYLNDQFFIASHSQWSRLDFVYFTKRPPLSEAAKRMDKLSSWEPKVTPIEIPGPKGRRLERCLSMNTTQDMLLVWWSMECGEAWPWTPITSDKDRANMVLLAINGPNVDIQDYMRTEWEPLHVHFSSLQRHRIFSLELGAKANGEVKARSCTYEIIRGKIQTASVVNIPLKSPVVCQSRNPQEDKVVLGLGDASLVMFDDYRKLTLCTRASVPPSSMAWHPSGNLLVVASSRADIQVFDRALSPLTIHLVGESPSMDNTYLRLSKFFRTSISLKGLSWCPYGASSSQAMQHNTDALYFNFDKGPASVLMFHLGVGPKSSYSCEALVKTYVRQNQVDEAVSLLSSMKWDSEGPACYACLSAIANHLLKKPLNAQREAQLETALATFYAPKPAISESTILEYREQVGLLARRFFHLLLRYVRFDKAFLLAVDMGARDLFMDIHYMAREKGELALAEVTAKKAELCEESYTDTLRHDDNLIDEVPLPGEWSPAQTTSQQQAEARKQHQLHEASIDAHFTNGELMGEDLISDYTTALMDPWSRHKTGEAGDRASPAEPDNREPESPNLKVIHFGIV